MAGFSPFTFALDQARYFPQCPSSRALPRVVCNVSNALHFTKDLASFSRTVGTWATTVVEKQGVARAVQTADERPCLTSQASSTKLQDQGHLTGKLSRLPIVPPAAEHLATAIKRAQRMKQNVKLKNELERIRNQATRKMDGLAKEVCVPLGRILQGFPPRDQLHPFEQALMVLTIGSEAYERRINQVDALRRSTLEVGKSYAARAGKAQSKKEVLAVMEEGVERVKAVYNKGSQAVDDLKDMVKLLRRLPVVDPKLPTVALVGAPNVGKSSLVQVLSSGTPEVCNYPFTTRSIKMGHFFVDGRRHQVTDTPGLLARVDEDRNAMENLTLACLAHLPTSVLFVIDLTGECGTSLEDQWAIRKYLKDRFPHKPWVDVFSKGDLIGGLVNPLGSRCASTPLPGPLSRMEVKGSAGLHDDQSGARNFSPDPADGSAEEGSGTLDHTDKGILAPSEAPAMPGAVLLAEGNGVAILAGCSPVGGAPMPRTAAEFFACIPEAVTVSSETSSGLDTLKERVLTMLGCAEW